MAYSRLGRLEERKEKRRLTFAILGILAVVVLILLFGVKALIGFSLLVDRLRGGSPAAQQSQTIILPPTLDSPVIATNSAAIPITGKGQPTLTLILYVNNDEFKKIPVPDTGVFSFPSVPLSNGLNTMSAKLEDSKGNVSDLSNVVSVTYGNTPPKLIVSDPADNTNVSGDTNTVVVNGMTDDNVTVTINDRLVVIKTDNSFSYNFPLNEGDNQLTIVATDTAGNQTDTTRKVTYRK